MAHEIHAPWGEIIPDVGPMTADGLLAMGDANKWCELVDGVLIKMSPTGYQRGKYGRRLAQALGVFVDQHELGDVVIGETGFLLSQPGEPDTVLAPDIAFVRAERVPPANSPEIAKFQRLAPDLVVEIASPDQYRLEMAAKANVYLHAGVCLIWVVWPGPRTVDVWQSGSSCPAVTLTTNEVLNGMDVIPGFAFPLAGLFE